MDGSTEDVFRLRFYEQLIVLTLSPIIIITNLAVLVSSKLLLCCRRKTPTSIVEEGRIVSLILLGNLALADIAVAIIFPWKHLFPQAHQDKVGCTIMKAATAACLLTSMCCIVLIATDRYFFIVHSIRYDHYMTESRARLLIYLSWILGLLFGFVPNTLKVFYKTETDIDCRLVTTENLDGLLTIGGFALPLLLATFALYMAIYFKARAVSTATWSTFKKTGAQRLKTRSVVVVFMSSSCFLLTWGPFFISIMLYGTLCGGNLANPNTCKTLQELTEAPFPMLGFLNSLLNPIIFAWWHRPFTRGLYEIFCPSSARKTVRTKSVDISTITSSLNISMDKMETESKLPGIEISKPCKLV